MEAKNPYRYCQDDYCYHPTCLDNKARASAWEEGHKAGKQEGRRGVVEWIIENGQSIETAHESHMSGGEFFLGLNPDDWQAKLKEWGG